MIKIIPKFGKTTGYNTPLWYCRNCNITTASYDRGRCIARHIEKLKRYGFTDIAEPRDEVAAEFCRNPWKEE